MTILIPTRTWVFLFMTSLMAVISGALAAQTMKLPNSCTPIVTVEKESCFVETIARCGNTMRPSLSTSVSQDLPRIIRLACLRSFEPRGNLRMPSSISAIASIV